MGEFRRLRGAREEALLDAYRFPGFRPLAEAKGMFGDPLARVVTQVPRSKKHVAVPAATIRWAGTTGTGTRCAISRADRSASSWSSRSGASTAAAAAL